MGTEISRQALYDLVWSRAKTQVAKGLGISDVALGKICKKSNIPVPPRGYWAMREAQRRHLRVSLPDRGLGQNDIVTIGPRRSYWPEEPIKTLPPPPQFLETMASVVGRAREKVGKVTVPRNLNRPHYLVTKLLEEDQQRMQSAAESRYYWDNPRFVAPAARRRLRLINALFLALTEVGIQPSYRGKDADALYALVGDQLVNFVIEPLRKDRQQDRMFVDDAAQVGLPLRLFIDSHADCSSLVATQWQDTESVQLEAVVADALISILVHGEAQYRANAANRYQRLVDIKRDQEEAIRRARELAEQQERALQLKREKERRQRLLSQTKNWTLAAEIRGFVASLRLHKEAGHYSEALDRWARWALAEADSIDPLRASLADLLGGNDSSASVPEG